MFSSLKFSSLRSRSRHKGTGPPMGQEENSHPASRFEDNDEGDVVSCGPSLRCQQPFGKCNAGKSHHDKHGSKAKCSNACGFCTTPIKIQQQQQQQPTKPCCYKDTHPLATSTNDLSVYVTPKNVDVHIERDDEGSLGLTLQGGLHHDPELSRPLVVTYVRPDGPTSKEGTIQVGDRLLAVDGFPLDKVTLTEAYNILKNGEGRTSRLTIEYDITNMKRFSGPLLVEMESPHPHQLGLTLTNTPHNAAVLIDEIKPASIAERCGALFAGDQILSVNDTRIEGSRIPATEVYKLLRICGGTHTNLLLQILPANVFVQSQMACKSAAAATSCYCPEAEMPSFDNSAYPNNYYEVPNEYNIVPTGLLNNRPANDLEKTDKIKLMTVTLHSDDKLGYGLSVYFCPSNNAVTISFITPEGPADLCEKLQVNDRILSINQMPVSGIGSEFQPLHKIPGVPLGKAELLVEYDLQDTYVRTSQENVFTLELMKYNKKNLGITVTGSSDCMQVSEIKLGSVADRCGVLSVGDKIRSINGRALTECTVQEASSILHSPTDTVTLEIEKLSAKNKIVAENCDEYIEYTVQLNKQNGPIGITISGSDTCPKQIIISALTPGGLAEKTGALHVGDRVLEINDQDVSTALLSHAIALLQNSQDKVLFKVSRNSSNYSRQHYADERNQRIYGSPAVLSDDSAVESWESSTHRDVSPNDTPPFHNLPSNSRKNIRDADECGIEQMHSNAMVANFNSPPPSEPVYSNIPYRRDRSVVYYDQVPFKNNCPININGGLNDNQRYCMDNLYENNEYSKFHEPFKNVDDIFNIADLHDFQEMNEAAHEVYQVILFKDPLYEDFGFSISDGLYERGVFLNRIRNGGPADKIGLLKPFDRIIQVNNIRTEDFDCCLTVPLIASAGDRITLTVKRKKLDPSFDSVKNPMKSYMWMGNPIKEDCPELTQHQIIDSTNTI